MSSFTSSSDVASRRRVGAVLISMMLLLSFALLEGITREKLVPASKDMSRYRTYPGRARSLIADSAPRIALIGNSTTERGVVLDVMKHEWEKRTGAPLSVDMFVADASGVSTWYWMVAHYFWKQNLEPDLFVVTYYGSGLADSSVMEVGRIAQFFSDPGDIPMLFTYDITTLEQRTDYLLSSVFQTFAARDRIRERTLNLIPGYQAFATATNNVNFELKQRHDLPSEGPRYTYHALHRLIDRARREGVQVCFVAFPYLPKKPGTTTYEIAPEVLEAINAAGMLHVDLRHVEGLSPSMYEDAIHLNVDGRPIYTRKFAEELAKIWPSQKRLNSRILPLLSSTLENREASSK